MRKTINPITNEHYHSAVDAVMRDIKLDQKLAKDQSILKYLRGNNTMGCDCDRPKLARDMCAGCYAKYRAIKVEASTEVV